MSTSLRFSFPFVLLGWLLLSAGTNTLFFIGPVNEAESVGLQYTPTGLFKWFVPLLVASCLVFFIASLLVRSRILLRRDLYIVFILTVLALGIANTTYYYSFVREYILITAFVFALATFLNVATYRYIHFCIVAVTSAIVLMSYMTVFIFPSYGVAVGVHEGRWQGVFTSKNGLGAFCVFALIILLHSYLVYRKRYLALLSLACMYLAFRSESYTSYVLIFFILLYFSFHARYDLFRLRLFADAGAIFFLFTTSLVVFLVIFLDINIDFLGKENFNNRDIIWDYYYSMALEKPFFGHGLAQLKEWAVINSDDIVSSMGLSYPVSSTHNGFIDLFYSYGLLGILVFLSLIKRAFCLCTYSIADRFLKFSFLTTYLVLNLFESQLLGVNLPTLYALLIFSYLWKLRHERNYRT